ncbi:hypothetical protein QYE76_039567 [Lolium multiflorum]|uniref:eRF1/Pelota-like N-terminal domain-containing protein n=1 Tax=Lolium multiflorum TaxID=4521 RepID=A0AAD8TBD6_LOLMU|nr:hypothetical protein QYE76_039567 [Lolium multiflorum]
MKLVTRNLVPNGPGSVKLVPQVDDDLWDAYNLITAGDTVEAVTSVEYATEDSLMGVCGKNQTKNGYVQIGQYHTLELELKRPFILRKEVWDWPALDRIQQSCDDTAANADLAVLLMQEGLAHLFLIGRSVMATRARVEVPIPMKHGCAMAAYDTALNDFFARVLDSFLSHVDFGLVQCVVIASPGFTKDQFRDHMLLQATRRSDMRAVTENKARIVLARAPSGYPHNLKDVLGDRGEAPLRAR